MVVGKEKATSTEAGAEEKEARGQTLTRRYGMTPPATLQTALKDDVAVEVIDD